MELAMGRRPRDLMDPASMNSQQLTSTLAKQDLLNEEIQKLAMKTHLEIQQPQDIRRDLAERMKFVPPDLREGRKCVSLARRSNKIQQGRKSGKWLKVENIVCHGSHGCCQYWSVFFSGECKQTKMTFGLSGLGRTSRFA